MPIALPGPEKLPDGPVRAFVVELHRLYDHAGRPAARAISRKIFADKTLESVSHETVSSLLRGGSIPSWAKVESIVIVLNRQSVQQADQRELRIRFNRLWSAVSRGATTAVPPPSTSVGRPDEVRTPPAPQTPAPQTPAPQTPAPARPDPSLVPDPSPSPPDPPPHSAPPAMPDPPPRARPSPPPHPRLPERSPGPPPREPLMNRVDSGGDMPDPNPHFTGRELLLDTMVRRQAENPNAPLVLCGPLGTGKTQLAREYVRRHADDYSVVWWVPAGDAARARRSLIGLAAALGLPRAREDDQTLAGLFFNLKSRPLRYMIVFDELDSGDSRALVRMTGGNVVVTTRDVNWARNNANIGLEVPDLDPGEAVQFLRKRDPHLDLRQAGRLVARVGRSPLALEQVSVMRGDPATSWEDLIDGLGAPGVALLSAAEPPGHYPMTVVDAVRAALSRLAALDPSAAGLAALFAGFGPDPVSVPMLLAGAHGGVSPDLREILADPVGLRRRWPVIVRCGLARLDAEGERIEMAPIVRLALREILPEAARQQSRNDVLEILTAADPGPPDDPGTWDRHRAIAPHVRPAGLIDWDRAPAYETVRRQIRFLFLVGEYTAAQRLGRDADAAWARQGWLSPNHQLVLLAKREWANALRAIGRYAESERLTAGVMAELSADRAYTPDHPIALDLARSRGHDLRIAGEYERAYQLDLVTWRRHADVYDDEDDDRTVASRYNLAVSLRFIGRFAEAEQRDRAELERLRGRLDPTDRRVVRTVDALAEDLYGLGRYQDLLDLLAPVLEAGPGRDRTGRGMLRARRMAALARRRLGDVAIAVAEMSACYHACVVALGEESELTLAAAMSYSNALRDTGQGDTALHHAMRAVRGYERAMGADNPLAYAARVNAAAVLQALDRHSEARALNEDAHRALSLRLGERHPFTVVAAINLAGHLAAADDHQAARLMSARAYAGAREAFGAEHPDTLVAAANLVADHVTSGAGSGRSLDAVLSVLRRSLGPGHPLVLGIAGGIRAVSDIEPPSA